MSSNISFNPVLTSVASGTFSVQSDGYVQGVALDDPAIRNSLAGGILASTETLPMWGGIAIFEDLPAAGADALGGTVGRAADNAHVTGFSVFNQAHHWVTSPQSEVPSAGAGMTIPFYRIGSGARIAVQCDPALVSLDGGLISQQVSWDFTNQKLIAYSSGIGALACKVLSVNTGNSKTVTYDSVNNLVHWSNTGAVAIILL